MAIGPGQPGHDFTQQGIIAGAPHASGVYAIYNDGWIYFGESDDLQRRLLEHLADDSSCIMRQVPTGFTYELVRTWGARVARQNQLIARYLTPCNQLMR